MVKLSEKLRRRTFAVHWLTITQRSTVFTSQVTQKRNIITDTDMAMALKAVVTALATL